LTICSQAVSITGAEEMVEIMNVLMVIRLLSAGGEGYIYQVDSSQAIPIIARRPHLHFIPHF
jgi:hypothetical protein